MEIPSKYEYQQQLYDVDDSFTFERWHFDLDELVIIRFPNDTWIKKKLSAFLMNLSIGAIFTNLCAGNMFTSHAIHSNWRNIE